MQIILLLTISAIFMLYLGLGCITHAYQVVGVTYHILLLIEVDPNCNETLLFVIVFFIHSGMIMKIGDQL